MRHLSREHAIQALYQLEMVQSRQIEKVDQLLEQLNAPADTQAFTKQLVQGTLAHQPEIDQILEQHLEHWKLSRLSVVVRNLLRLAVYEMHYDHLPYEIVINETLELAKAFADDITRSFINSVLQKVHDHADP